MNLPGNMHPGARADCEVAGCAEWVPVGDLSTRLRALHLSDGQWCLHDGYSWPCATIRILDAES
jgi:hypothetical protein